MILILLWLLGLPLGLILLLFLLGVGRSQRNPVPARRRIALATYASAEELVVP